jgi:GxxExxY protein
MNTDDADQTQMKDEETRAPGKHDHLTRRIIGVFYDVYNELGYGFLECVYREAMRLALVQEGLIVSVEVPVPVEFRGVVIGTFRADLVVNDAVLIELKSCDSLLREHESQTVHYLRATKIEVALLMNFGRSARFKRLVMDNIIKQPKRESVESVLIGVKPFAEVPKVIS